MTKFGEKGVLNMGRAIPLLGGVVGATFEVVATNAVGNVARDVFCAEDAKSGKGGAAMLLVGSTDSGSWLHGQFSTAHRLSAAFSAARIHRPGRTSLTVCGGNWNL